MRTAGVRLYYDPALLYRNSIDILRLEPVSKTCQPFMDIHPYGMNKWFNLGHYFQTIHYEQGNKTRLIATLTACLICPG